MLVTEQFFPNSLILTISGRFDQNNDVALEKYLLVGEEKNVHHVVFNLEQVSSIDTAGIGRIFITFFRLKEQGICLSLVNPKPAVGEILSLVEIPKILRVFESNDAALSWQAASPQFPSSVTATDADWDAESAPDFQPPHDWASPSQAEANA